MGILPCSDQILFSGLNFFLSLFCFNKLPSHKFRNAVLTIISPESTSHRCCSATYLLLVPTYPPLTTCRELTASQPFPLSLCSHGKTHSSSGKPVVSSTFTVMPATSISISHICAITYFLWFGEEIYPTNPFWVEVPKVGGREPPFTLWIWVIQSVILWRYLNTMWELYPSSPGKGLEHRMDSQGKFDPDFSTLHSQRRWMLCAAFWCRSGWL